MSSAENLPGPFPEKEEVLMGKFATMRTVVNFTTRGASQRRYRGVGRGFTLLELAVVIFLIGLMMTLAMPYFGGMQSSQMRSESRRLASRANYLYEEAGAQKVILRLTFDFANNRYFASRLDPFAAKPAFHAENGPAGVPVILPAGIWIRDVTVEGLGTFQRGVVSAQFYPGGYVDATMIHLADSKGEVFTLAIDPFSGHVSIVRGDVRPANGGRSYQ